MPTFGRIGLSGKEVGQIMTGHGSEIRLSLWDRIKDFFRPETKRETIDNLVSLMQEPDNDAQVYLRNFEALASHAKTGELRQFGLEVVRDPHNKNIATLQFRVGGQEIANQELNVGGHLDHLVSYAALYALRGEAADLKSAHQLHLWVDHKDITHLIDKSAEHIDGTRHRYGQLMRQIEGKISAAGGSTNPFGEPPRPTSATDGTAPSTNPFDEPPRPASATGGTAPSTNPFDEPPQPASATTPFIPFERPAEPIGFIPRSVSSTSRSGAGYQPLPSAVDREGLALNVLKTIDAQVTSQAGPRTVVRALAASDLTEGLKIKALIDRDADLSGASARTLVAGKADFSGVSIRTLQAEHVSFEAVELPELQSLKVDLGDISLAELVDMGVKGGDTPVFVETEAGGRPHAAIPIYAHPEAPKLKLPVLLDARFTVADVPVKRLADHFDVHGCPYDTLRKAKANFWDTDLARLHGMGVDFHGVNATTLLAHGIPLSKAASAAQAGRAGRGAGITLDDLVAEMGVSPRGAKATDLFAQGLERVGCSLDALLTSEVDLQDLELKTFVTAGGKCAGVNLRRLQQEDMKFTDTSFEYLRDNDVSMDGVTAAELIEWTNVKGAGVQQLMDAKVAAEGISVKELLGQEISFSGARMTDVRAWDPDLNHCFVSTLLDQGANFQEASVKWLKDGGASFAGVTYLRLREAGCDFSGLTAADVADLSKNKGFFQDVSVADLLAQPGLNVAGWRLDDLTRGGAKLGNLSTEELLRKEIRLNGASADVLIGARGTSVKELLSNGASFANTRMTELREQNADLNGTFVRLLLDADADFTGASVKWLQQEGASFAGVNYLQLRAVGCDFVDLTSDEFAALGNDKDFFQGASADELLNAPDVRLAGKRLIDLPGIGELLNPRAPRNAREGVPVAAALRKTVSLEALDLAHLTSSKADLSGTHVLDLQRAKLTFPNVEFETLVNEGVSFAKMTPSQLPKGIRFNGCLGTDALAKGLQLATKADFAEFEERGGTVLKRQESRPRGAARTVK